MSEGRQNTAQLKKKINKNPLHHLPHILRGQLVSKPGDNLVSILGRKRGRSPRSPSACGLQN